MVFGSYRLDHKCVGKIIAVYLKKAKIVRPELSPSIALHPLNNHARGRGAPNALYNYIIK